MPVFLASHARARPRIAAGAAVFALLAGCGSKTGLREWDAAPDTADVMTRDAFDVPDVFDAPDIVDAPDVIDAPDVFDAPDIVDAPDVQDIVEACVPGRFTLFRREAEAMLVIDRSSSMRYNLDGLDMPPSRWTVLRAALARALPPFETVMSVGALFFPDVPPFGSTDIRDQCRVSTLAVDVPPARSATRAVLNVFDSTGPGGGTPTYEAITATGRYLLSRGSRAIGRYMVLATDGGPNCNGALPRATCACTSRDATGNPNCSVIPTGAYNCVDDLRTIASIDAALRVGIPTYVIGIDDTMRPDLTEVLNRLADAGGRPNMRAGSTRYYSIRSPEDLDAAFTSIQRAIVRCAYVTPSSPTDPDMIAIEVDGRLITRDITHTNGWDWTDRGFGEITFFGATCERVAAGAPAVTARVGCNDR